MKKPSRRHRHHGLAIGRVKEVGARPFLLTRRWALDRWLPAACVQRVRDGQVVLMGPARQIKSLGWTSVDVVAAVTMQLSSTGMEAVGSGRPVLVATRPPSPARPSW